ncbi:hypothetical protein CSC94_11460 [Zhengella mangrovi]|uniref:Uncharacterized protein n=1 Tax=Zhengella mangrovi TaxID=1982044 RepID=A0A2G1QNV0_9HYPH|nr:hypothetical protein [Zhengella mangrovi]PHP67151.1 hypothetical protein CSC94_11460 [Zhengella mangrovi]
MNMLPVPVTIVPTPPLEEVEFEMAIQIQDIRTSGFAQSVSDAAASIGGRMLFDLPCPSGTGCQRVAAIAADTDGGDTRVMLVILSEDGLSVGTENAIGSDHIFAGFALSHAALDEHLGNLDLDGDTEEEDDEA